MVLIFKGVTTMSNMNSEILNLIKIGKTLNEISTATNLSNRQIFQRIKQLEMSGYNFDRTYFYNNGDITYSINKTLYNQDKNKRIIVNDRCKEFKAVVISDLHIGSELESLQALNLVYDYCVKKGINIIINAGDIINGSFGVKNKYDDLDDQIKHLLKNYPHDRNILNFVCLGNHDFDLLRKKGKNLETILHNNRHDIIPLGYSEGIINIRNEKIIVRHPINNERYEEYGRALYLKGHTHKMMIKKSKNLLVHVPTLSNIHGHNPNLYPSFLHMTIRINNDGYFQVINLEQLSVNNEIYKISETDFTFQSKSSPKRKVLQYQKSKQHW